MSLKSLRYGLLTPQYESRVPFTHFFLVIRQQMLGEGEEDFQDSVTLLEERMAEIGARVVTLLKFHPEVNPIECVYR